ncbi:unnamed protein product, partial [Meganyctiphanes norvegica]
LNRVVVAETIYQDEVESMSNILKTEFTVLGTAVNGSPPQIPVDNLSNLNQIVSSGKPVSADDPSVKRRLRELGFLLPEGLPKRRTQSDPRTDVRTDERTGHKRQQHRDSPSKSSHRLRSPSGRRHHESPGHGRASSPGTAGRRRSPGTGSQWESSGRNRMHSPSLRDTRERGEYGRTERPRDDRYSPDRRHQRDSRSRSRPREFSKPISENRSFSPRSSRNRTPDNEKLQSGNSIYGNLPHGGPQDYSNMPRNGGGVGFGQDSSSIIVGGGSSLPISDASIIGPTVSTSWSSGSAQPPLVTGDWRGAAVTATTATERSSSSSTDFHNRNVGRPDFNNRMENYPKREVFSIYDTCAMLTVICDRLGIIGISFKATLQRAMEFKSNSIRMLETFREPEVMSLMEVVVKKLKELEDKSSGIERERCKEYLHHMSILIDRTKALSQPPEARRTTTLSQPPEAASKRVLYGLDIESIAKLTVGKDNPFVISAIKDRLLATHGRVDSDQFSEIFKAVSMLQFNMMINNPNSGGINSTQAAVGKRESPDKNLGIFNKDTKLVNPQVEWNSKQGTEESRRGVWENPKDVSTLSSSVNNRWEQDRQGYSESSRASGSEWEDKRLGGVEPNWNNRENLQQRPAISSDRGRMDKYDPMEAGNYDDDYGRDKNCNWNNRREELHNREINSNTSEWGSNFNTQGSNNSSSDVWRQGTIKDMEQILGSSLIKGGNWPSQSEQQNTTNFAAGTIQNRPVLPEGNLDQVGGSSGVNRWEQSRGIGVASNPESEWNNSRAAQSSHNMGPANWEHKQELGRGSTGTWVQGTTAVDRRQPGDFDKQQGLQSFSGSNMWNNPVGKDSLDRNVVDYGHQGSTSSDRKVVDYGHQKGQASVTSTFGNHDNSVNTMDSRYRTDPGLQQPFSSAGSNQGSLPGPRPFMTTSSAPTGSQHGTQYAREEQYPRMPHMDQRFGEQSGPRFTDQVEPRFTDEIESRFSSQSQSSSSFNNVPRRGNQIGARFSDQPKPDPRYGDSNFSDKWY